jgi:16S rRNA C967 or C1407 C5-methylase (RsmB/RsmF family)
MGRFQKRRKGGNKGGGGGGNNPERSKGEWNDGEGYVKMVVELGHYKMEAYYAAQGMHNTRWTRNGDNDELVPCANNTEKEAERMKWRSTSIKILPASFRISKDVPVSLREQMEAELADILESSQQNGEEEGSVVNQLKFLPHAYQLEVDRTAIRKKPHLAKLHEWLKQQTLAGFITRQETVSMVPPVVMSPKPSDRILDMCAAPGSKTSQLLEDLGPTGCIVANDANVQRAQ